MVSTAYGMLRTTPASIVPDPGGQLTQLPFAEQIHCIEGGL